MEFILVLAVIAVLCIIFRVGTDIMILGALGLIGLTVAAMALFFVIFIVLLITSAKKDAVLSGIEKKEGGRFRTAFYKINGKEYPCFFPAEPKIMYKKDKPCRVLLNKRLGRVFDRFAVITCICGLLFSLIAVSGAVMIICWAI